MPAWPDDASMLDRMSSPQAGVAASRRVPQRDRKDSRGAQSGPAGCAGLRRMT
jgi:hypothetical protein